MKCAFQELPALDFINGCHEQPRRVCQKSKLLGVDFCLYGKYFPKFDPNRESFADKNSLAFECFLVLRPWP